MPQGLFVSLDGLDGCGKSTQSRLLADALEKAGHNVVSCVDPGGTEVGKTLREMLLHHKGHLGMRCEALLFMASRAQLVDEVILPAMNNGCVVISDRYLLANVVYQGYGGGLSLDDLKATGMLSTGGVFPDLTVLLDIPVSVARQRIQRPADRMERRPDRFFEDVRQGFLTEAARDPARVLVMDASRDVQLIHAEILARVEFMIRHRSQS